MEHNRRRNYRPRLSDSEPYDLSRTELTRTDSDSSAISMDTYRDISHQCMTPFPDELTRWTDWQHSLYLNSLEASFVNELYRSMHLRGSWNVQNNLNEIDKSRTSQMSCNMSGQFLILQDDCWKRVSHERNEPMLESTGDPHVLAGSPWRFTSVERDCAMRDFSVDHCGWLCGEGHKNGKSIFSGGSLGSSGKQDASHPCYPEQIASTAEFTDQNFEDEDQGLTSSSVPIDKKC